MFLKSLLNPANSLAWTIFHIVLALACTITPYALVIWFYIILLSNVSSALNHLSKNRYYLFIALLFYLISFEMLGRMARTSPYIPSELGKYFLITFALLGILIKGTRSTKGVSMALLLLPALLYDLSDKRTFIDIIYNLFGPFATALGIALLYRAPISQQQFNRVLQLIWYTTLSALFFTFIKTPDFDTIEFDLGAQFTTTADTPSNQVSTVLGLGMFLSFYSIINKLKFSGLLILDIVFLLLFAFQGLLSFSRGGMLIAALGMLILVVYSQQTPYKISRSRLLIGSVFAILGLYFVFQVANQITDGKLLLRYQGETQGTLLGNKEKTTDVIVSGRVSILREDFNLWIKNPITGVGAAASRYLRDRTKYVSPHIEFSRLLAEHGIFGILYFITLLSVFWSAYNSLVTEENKGVLVALFTIALLTTFQAAMRTYISPSLFILATLLILPDINKSKNNAHSIDRRSQPSQDSARR